MVYTGLPAAGGMGFQGCLWGRSSRRKSQLMDSMGMSGVRSTVGLPPGIGV